MSRSDTLRATQRALAGYTQKTLAAECHVSVKTVRAWEHGELIRNSSRLKLENAIGLYTTKGKKK